VTVGEAQPPSTVGEWLQALEPAPPPALAARLAASLHEHLERPTTELPEACLAAGEALLAQLLGSGSTTRETALDLLAVDSLVTYAAECAADDPARLDARTAAAMQRIAAFPVSDPGSSG
jgi:hypothetical protein